LTAVKTITGAIEGIIWGGRGKRRGVRKERKGSPQSVSPMHSGQA